MNKNPFKFGSIVDDPYFTNRTREIEKVRSVVESHNHLILISPRRYGKSSLVFKVVGKLKRPVIALDLQLITSPEDLAAQLLKRIYRVFPAEKIRQFVRQFRIIPTISLNPVNNEVDISFQPSSGQSPVLEDVLNLVEKLSNEKRRAIVVFDEFQEIQKIDPELGRQLRSVMQHHQFVNYVFLGSQESLIRMIFERKKSPFYHFGILFPLGKIPRDEFMEYLVDRLTPVSINPGRLAEEILNVTDCHPYYTQQLAFMVWEDLERNEPEANGVKQALNELTSTHDMDYERLWNNFNKTDKKLLIGLASSSFAPLSESFNRTYGTGATSTVFSSLKRLMINGYVIKNDTKYEIDDPFFKIWLQQRRVR
jgi:hypothetical protein